MDDYPMYSLLVGFSLWRTLWRLLFPLGVWHTLSCRVLTTGGAGTTPYRKEQDAEAAKVLAGQKARKEELEKKAKKVALLAEKAKKEKELEEELKRLQKEKEEVAAVVDEEEEEEEEEVQVPLQKNVRTEERGESNGKTERDKRIEKKVNEWVANVVLGEEEEPMLIVPRAKGEAVIRELEKEEDPLCRQVKEEEQKCVLQGKGGGVWKRLKQWKESWTQQKNNESNWGQRWISNRKWRSSLKSVGVVLRAQKEFAIHATLLERS
ncbi:hypothetical protein CBR_g72630 [Chara braunii]|uniref:Uncharacterized protein n=1 Tax=Chara braunii TaxID=69332 RepID=A0A388K9W7_CHABU|nr:hypothetical protein CBR_g72630 [Chara braunii]|eukprot:GBG66874.1 hypothetical protein CBR_g72630 [Chara braunii]